MSKSTDRSRAPLEEKKSGSKTIIIIVGVIVLLIFSSSLIPNILGVKEKRGDKARGALCETTTECQKNLICYPHKDEPMTCRKLCDNNSDCDEGYSCTTVIGKLQRRSMSLKKVCIPSNAL